MGLANCTNNCASEWPYSTDDTCRYEQTHVVAKHDWLRRLLNSGVPHNRECHFLHIQDGQTAEGRNTWEG